MKRRFFFVGYSLRHGDLETVETDDVATDNLRALPQLDRTVSKHQPFRDDGLGFTTRSDHMGGL